MQKHYPGEIILKYSKVTLQHSNIGKVKLNYYFWEINVDNFRLVLTILLMCGLIIITMMVLQAGAETARKVQTIGRLQDKE